MKTRAQNIATINELWGAPGQSYETDDGRRLLHRIVDVMGLEALTDAAVARLAEAHQAQEIAVSRLPHVYPPRSGR